MNSSTLSVTVYDLKGCQQLGQLVVQIGQWEDPGMRLATVRLLLLWLLAARNTLLCGCTSHNNPSACIQ